MLEKSATSQSPLLYSKKDGRYHLWRYGQTETHVKTKGYMNYGGEKNDEKIFEFEDNATDFLSIVVSYLIESRIGCG